MVKFVISKQSAASVGNYMNSVRGRILNAIAEGMGEEMETLAQTVASKFDGDPLHSITGNLVAKILSSPKVVETSGAIRGSVSAQDGAKNLGLWLEKGIKVPAISTFIAFSGVDYKMAYSQGHQAFSEGPKPFMIPSLIEREPPIFEHIRQKVIDAI